jgi:quercetin dioxygenase-like cupin family protein
MKWFMIYAAGFALSCGMAAAPASGTNPLATSRAFLYEQMPVTANPNGSEGRRVATGTLATGEAVGIHESMQPVGMTPNPAHAIQHTELIVVQQGTLEFLHDGKTERVGPGGIIYVAFGTTHAVKNVGDVPAKYVVIQIGGDTKE